MVSSLAEKAGGPLDEVDIAEPFKRCLVIRQQQR
jgi:hypothetical protein